MAIERGEAGNTFVGISNLKIRTPLGFSTLCISEKAKGIFSEYARVHPLITTSKRLDSKGKLCRLPTEMSFEYENVSTARIFFFL